MQAVRFRSAFCAAAVCAEVPAFRRMCPGGEKPTGAAAHSKKEKRKAAFQGILREARGTSKRGQRTHRHEKTPNQKERSRSAAGPLFHAKKARGNGYPRKAAVYTAMTSCRVGMSWLVVIQVSCRARSARVPKSAGSTIAIFLWRTGSVTM